MSEYRIQRKGSSKKSGRGGRRRRSSVRSMGSYGAKDEDEEELLKMLEQEYQKAIERNNNNSNRRRKRNTSEGEDGQMDGEEDEEGEEEDEDEEEEEEQIDQEELLAKMQHCKELIEGVKRQTWKISKKLQVHRSARAYVENFEGKLSRRKGYQQRGRELVKRLQRSWNNFAASLVPWEMKIKRIESHFGSVVASYFTFLRWLLWVSVWLAAIPTCFIIIPELLVGSSSGSSTRKQVPENDREVEADLKTIWNAEGIVQYSPIFYGYYGNADKIGQGYRLPLAYLVTGLAAFAFSFIVVLKTMAANSRQSRVSESSDEEYIFSWKLFTEWDYMIASHETATTKHASITTTFKESILEEQEKAREGNRYLQIFLRVLANIIILILLATSTYVIQLFVERSREMEINKRNNPELEPGFWDANELTVIMTLISTIFPNILDLISIMEKYHPRTSLRLMLARIFVLNLLNLYTLFIALYNKQNDLLDSLEDLQTNLTATTNCSTLSTNDVNSDLVLTTSATPDQSTNSLGSTQAQNLNGSGVYNVTVCQELPPEGTIASLCWETMIGQEVFKLTVTDMVFVVGQILLIDVIRTFFIKYANNLCCWDMEKTFPEYPDFKTAENLLHLISNQGTIWLGSFFAPGLPLLNLVKLIMLVYLRCWVVLTFNAPQERIFRASRSNNFYYSLLLIMLFLCMLPPLFAIVAVEPSPYCGPFSGSSRIYHVLTRTMTEELPASVSAVIEYAASPGVILPVFMLLGMTIYYLISVGRSLRDVNSDLKLQLEYERTEGRKKVYAMADAKHEASEKAKGKGWVAARTRLLSSEKEGGNKNDMASTANSVLKALRASKALTDMANRKSPSVAPKPRRKGGEEGGGGGGRGDDDDDGGSGMSRRTLSLLQKLQEAQRVQTSVPVAVIEGKQSVKAGRERDKHEAKKVFREALLAHSKRHRKHEVQDDNDTHFKNFSKDQRETSRSREREDSKQAHFKRRQERQSNSSHPKSSRRNGDDLEIEETEQDDSPPRRVGNYRSTKNRYDKSTDRPKERKTRAEIHNFTKENVKQAGSHRNRTQRTSRALDRGEAVRHNHKDSAIRRNTANTKTTDGLQSENVRPKKLLRRLSSSSVIDENGHLKPYDENDDDDDDDDDEDDDDSDQEQSDDYNDRDEDVEDFDGEMYSSEDEQQSDANRREGSDERSNESSGSEEETKNVAHSSGLNGLSDAHERHNQNEDENAKVSSMSEKIKAWNRKSESPKNQQSDVGKNRIRSSSPTPEKVKSRPNGNGPLHAKHKVTAEIELIDESKALAKNHLKGRHSAVVKKRGTENADQPRPVSKAKQSGETRAKNQEQVKERENTREKKWFGAKRTAKPTAVENPSNGKVPTITVEDFSATSSGAQQSEIKEADNAEDTQHVNKAATEENMSDEAESQKGGVESQNNKDKKPFLKSWKQKLVPKTKNASVPQEKSAKQISKAHRTSTDANPTQKQSVKDSSTGTEHSDTLDSSPQAEREAATSSDVGTSKDNARNKTQETQGNDSSGASKTVQHEQPADLKPTTKARFGVSKNTKTNTNSKEGLGSSKVPEEKTDVNPGNGQIFHGVALKPVDRSKVPRSADNNSRLQQSGDGEEQETDTKRKMSDLDSNSKPNKTTNGSSKEESPSPAVFTFDNPVLLTAGDVSPDIPANFGRFRTDRPSLANIFSDEEDSSQNGGLSDVNATDVSESGREDGAEDNRKVRRNGARQRPHTRGSLETTAVDNNSLNLSANTSVVHKETSSLPTGQKFTVLAITNGDLHLDASDEDF